MLRMFRLNEQESETIRKIAIEINKKRVENEKSPLKDSELLHEILEKSFKKIIVTKSGEISLEL